MPDQKTRTFWTPSRDIIIHSWASGEITSAVKAAEILGCTKNMVIGRAYRLKLKATYRRGYQPPVETTAQRLDALERRALRATT